MRFNDRHDAGQRLAPLLHPLASHHPVVMALPRGGVPVAFEVAAELPAPMDVLVIRKLGAPMQPELAIGAVGEEGVTIVNDSLVDRLGLPRDKIADTVRREISEVARQVARLRGGRDPVDVAGRTAIVVDDGIATGATARAAVAVLRARNARRVVLAVPVAPPPAIEMLRRVYDDVIVLAKPTDLHAVGEWYGDFAQITDDEVRRLVTLAAEEWSGPEQDVGLGEGMLGSIMSSSDTPIGVILFAHGSGSSRRSPRNRAVAAALRRAGFATVLFDLLTEDEALDLANVFDVELLAHRLNRATEWVRGTDLGHLPIGYFGASTGAAAALRAAADQGDRVAAVVCRGGRPDLAAERLGDVSAPTLLVVGGLDETVLALNRQAQQRLHAPNELAVVPGATHLFEETGALDRVAALAAEWFRGHMNAARTLR